MTSLLPRACLQESRRCATRHATARVVAPTTYGFIHRRNISFARRPVARTIQPAKPAVEGHFVYLKLHDEHLPFSALYLRDRCTCSQCVDPSSKQKNFLTTDIPFNIAGTVTATIADTASIEWTDDIEGFGPKHVTNIPLSSLEHLFPMDKQKSPRCWDGAKFAKQCADVTFDDYMGSDQTLLNTLQQLRRFGLAFITDVPDSEEYVAKIAERIGPVKNTLYGYTWDVRSVPNATNVAYTNKELGFHMDLLPLDLTPELQFLHCIKASATGGGNSLFTDAWTAAQDLWKEDPAAFLTLCDVPVTFHYDHPESHLYRKRVPVFQASFKQKGIDREAEFHGKWVPITQICWSPPFQGPFFTEEVLAKNNVSHLKLFNARLVRWHSAAEKFNKLLHRPSGIHERLMKPGECVIFVNTRVVHARSSFDVNAVRTERWLRGCYLDGDVWNSKESVLKRKLLKPETKPEMKDLLHQGAKFSLRDQSIS